MAYAQAVLANSWVPKSLILPIAQAAIADISGGSLKVRAANDHEVFDMAWGPNWRYGIGVLAADEIAYLRGRETMHRVANDQAVLASSCSANAAMLGIAAAAIDCISVGCANRMMANDQTGLASCRALNDAIFPREAAEIASSSGASGSFMVDNDHAVAASSGGANYAMMRIAASEIAARRGALWNLRRAHAQGVLARSCVPAWHMRVIAGAEIACRRGWCMKANLANDHAVPASSRAE